MVGKDWEISPKCVKMIKTIPSRGKNPLHFPQLIKRSSEFRHIVVGTDMLTCTCHSSEKGYRFESLIVIAFIAIFRYRIFANHLNKPFAVWINCGQSLHRLESLIVIAFFAIFTYWMSANQNEQKSLIIKLWKMFTYKRGVSGRRINGEEWDLPYHEA